MDKKKVIIIAEAGVNHNGSLNLAKKLILAASKANADYIKFQTYNPEDMVRRNTSLAKYQKKNLKNKISQYDLLKRYQLKKKYYKILIQFSKQNNIKFLSSPFDIDSINFLNKLNLDFIKIPSGEIDNFFYLKNIAKLNKKLILSTGMSNIKEIENAINLLTKFGTKRKNINLLHCHTDYPSEPQNLNLKAIQTLKKKFKLNVGYSDHSVGIEAPIIAVSYGSKIIEKHLTLDKSFPGPDHSSSLEPFEFKKMVTAIRNTEKMLGNGIKKPTNKELKNKPLVRKSIFAKISIKKGEKFSEKNLICKRPLIGISASKWYNLIGKRAKKNFKPDDKITLN
jgi:N,N'-diacetyllegionaminate synthase